MDAMFEKSVQPDEVVIRCSRPRRPDMPASDAHHACVGRQECRLNGTAFTCKPAGTWTNGVIKGKEDPGMLCREGEEGDNFYVIESGDFAAIKGGRQVFKYEGSGSFGELALLYNCPRAATVQVTNGHATRRPLIARVCSSTDLGLSRKAQASGYPVAHGPPLCTGADSADHFGVDTQS